MIAARPAQRPVASWRDRLRHARERLRSAENGDRIDFEDCAPILLDSVDRARFERVLPRPEGTNLGPSVALTLGCLRERTDPEGALAWLVRARALSDSATPELAARIALELGACHIARGELACADAALAWGSGLADVAELGDLAHLSALLADGRGDYRSAREHYRDAIARWPRTLTPLTTALAHSNLAVALHHKRPSEARALADEALRMVEAFELTPDVAPAMRNVLGYALICRGDLPGAAEQLDRAHREAATSGQTRIRLFTAFNRSIVHELEGELTLAKDVLERTSSDALEHGQAALVPWMHIRRSWLNVRSGDLDRAEEALDVAKGYASEQHGTALAFLEAAIAVPQRRASHARSRLREVMQTARERDDELTAFMAFLWLGLIEHEGGRELAARRAFAEAHELGTTADFKLSPNWWHPTVLQASVHAASAEHRTYFERIARRYASPEMLPRASVSVTGQGEILVDGRPLPTDVWREGRAGPRVLRRYLVALAHASPGGLTRDQICDLLWPESDGDTAVRNFYAATSDLRRVLTAAPGTRVALGGDGRYRLQI